MKKTISEYYSYYEYITSKCKKGQYNLLLHRHLGDSLVLLALRRKFEEKYNASIHYLISEKQEVLAKMYGVTNYTVVATKNILGEENLQSEYHSGVIDKFEEDMFESLFTFVPQRDMPFIAAPTSWIKERDGWENFVDGWAKMLGLSCNKLDPPLYYPELSTEASEKICELGGIKKIVLIAPEAHSFIGSDKTFWENIAKKNKKKGLVVVCNTINASNKIDGTINLNLSISDTIALGHQCYAVYSLRSGLCDCLVGRESNFHVYYTKEMWFKYLSLNECFNLETSINEYVISNLKEISKDVIQRLGRTAQRQKKK